MMRRRVHDAEGRTPTHM